MSDYDRNEEEEFYGGEEELNNDEELYDGQEEYNEDASLKVGSGYRDSEIMNQDDVTDKKSAKERVTSPYMTKYEKARILGTRSLQISMNAPVMVELDGETDALEIAMKELREKKIPLVIRRFLPDGTYEDWPVKDLIIE
ncbi:uncharacterized protein VTP21DRAFT_3964 [Calcarisporiella thermophila]|uniref:uncharacterized protein n=1 Tax=Calcarisporiella thermophila TaxID=911321 RepID=UPI00374256EC